MNKKLSYRSLMLIGLLIFLAACSRQEETPEEATAVPTNTPLPQPTATATTPPTAVPTLTPEPITAAITITEQTLTDDGTLTVDQVTLVEPGWLVIQVEEDDQPGIILATAALEAGEHETVEVQIDPMQATATMFAALHLDDGEPTVFEFPGPDQPITVDGTPVSQSFAVDIQASLPAISVSDQEVGENGVVSIDSVTSPESGFVALHLDDDGQPGRILSFAPVSAGTTEAISITVNWREATPQLHAVLYIDAGEPGRFEPQDEDRPLEIAGQPTAVPFQVILPPDVYVLDQPVIDGSVEIERAISYGPGWAVVYRDEEDAVGTIIGWALLEDGVNERVVVPVVESAVTPILYVMLHQDTGDFGEFGFPRTDPQILFKERLPDPFAFSTTSGNYLVTRDQQLSVSNTVTVSLAVVDTNAWVVVYNDAAGEPGEIIGRSWIPAGVNREIEVTIDPELTTTTLHVVLHLDASTPQRFDFPDGIDIPLQRNRRIIRAPFLLFSGAPN